MYPFQQSNELEDQIPYMIPSSCQPDKILNDLVTLQSSDLPVNQTGKKQWRSPEIQENKKDGTTTATTTTNEHKLKRIVHRDIERQRRQEMANLYASLRSLLPLENIKGKRAISDHMHEAVNYIKCLQKRISELGVRRDRLMKMSNLSTFSSPGNGSADSSLPNCLSVTVSPCLDGVEVLICTSPKEETSPLSKVLKKLLAEGLNVVSCVTTTVNDIVVHKILSQVTDQKSIDISGLQQKLTNVINLESHSDSHLMNEVSWGDLLLKDTGFNSWETTISLRNIQNQPSDKAQRL